MNTFKQYIPSAFSKRTVHFIKMSARKNCLIWSLCGCNVEQFFFKKHKYTLPFQLSLPRIKPIGKGMWKLENGGTDIGFR